MQCATCCGPANVSECTRSLKPSVKASLRSGSMRSCEVYAIIIGVTRICLHNEPCTWEDKVAWPQGFRVCLLPTVQCQDTCTLSVAHNRGTVRSASNISEIILTCLICIYFSVSLDFKSKEMSTPNVFFPVFSNVIVPVGRNTEKCQ